MDSEQESMMKMENEIAQVFEQDNKARVKKIFIVLGFLTLLVFVLGGLSKAPVSTAATSVAAATTMVASDAISNAASDASGAFGISMSNVDRLLGQLL